MNGSAKNRPAKNRPIRIANAARGESLLKIGDKDYILRPSFSALAAAESEIGSLFDFVERAASGQALLNEVAILFWHCLYNNGDIDRALFNEELATIGMVGMAPALKIILRQILQGQ